MAINIVQFTHPGGQHSLNRIERKNQLKEWNIGDHRRKFIIAKGQYVDGGNLSSPQDLLFWGEWEPSSKIMACFNPSDPILYPTYLHSPFIQLDKRGRVVKHNSVLKAKSLKGKLNCVVPGCVNLYNQFQNTDPFVFAENFYYSCCKQVHFTSLRSLDEGSIILFGSTISTSRGRPAFTLDTVFVVGEKRTYTSKTFKNDLSCFIPKYYDEIMGFKTWKTSTQFTCYKGASFNNPLHGMYSFVPCMKDDKATLVFSRVILTENDFKSVSIPSLSKYKKNKSVITDNLNSAPKVIASDLNTNKQVWDTLCKIIDSQGYIQGVNFQY